LDILIFAPQTTQKAEGFLQYLAQSGGDVRGKVVDALPSDCSEVPQGIVVFDDGAQKVSEWVAKAREVTRYLSVPVVAVTSRTDHDLQARLLAAGATAVCTADDPHARVVKEIRDRCNIQPVVAQIREQLVEPFTQATQATLEAMAGISVTVRSVYQKTDYIMFGDISAVIGLMGPPEGSMVIGFPKQVAEALASKTLAGAVDEIDDDMVRDCMGEIANVIAGQAKGLLENSPYHFTLSTPTIVAGLNHEIRHKPGMPCLVVAFGSDLGDFALQLCLNM
jgi:chemotaxis protein CheX